MSDPIEQISDILGAPKGWLDRRAEERGVALLGEAIGNHVAAEYDDDPALDRLILALRESLAAQPVGDDDDGPLDGCTGTEVCPAPAHQHGCFADLLGHCNEPEAHPAQPVTTTAPTSPRTILQAVLNDVHPAALGDGYAHFLGALRHVGEQFGVSDF